MFLLLTLLIVAIRLTLFYQWQAQEEALHETLRDMLLTYRGLVLIVQTPYFGLDINGLWFTNRENISENSLKYLMICMALSHKAKDRGGR